MKKSAINEGMQRMQQMVEPWYASIKNPQKAQEDILDRFKHIYQQTKDGETHKVGQIKNLQDFRKAYPVRTYDNYQPLIQRVMAGDTELLLNEEPIGWAITRGTTKGENKYIPMTPMSSMQNPTILSVQMQFRTTRRFQASGAFTTPGRTAALMMPTLTRPRRGIFQPVLMML